LILQEGELTGHHHAIAVPRVRNFAPASTKAAIDAALQTSSPKLQKHFGGAGKKPATTGTARMFRDPAAASAMVAQGLMTRADLAVGCLVVEGGPVELRHEEHDAIRIPEGNYLIGRQVESVGAEERRVAD